MKSGECFKGCLGSAVARFPQIGETTVSKTQGCEIRTRLHQCPDCGLVVKTYRDFGTGPWGQSDPRYWRTIKEDRPILDAMELSSVEPL